MRGDLIMLCDVHLLVGLLLTWSSLALAARVISEDPCVVHALVGRSLTLPLERRTLGDRDELRWTHNNKVVYHRAFGAVRVGRANDVDVAGSLLLTRLEFSDAGVYQAVVLNATQSRVNGWRGRVCITEKASKPRVSFACGVVALSCDVLDPQKDLVFSWTHQGQILEGETKPWLNVSLATLKNGRRDFGCSVRNGASQDQSDVVRLKCDVPSPGTYCFTAGVVMAGVAGGGGLLLLLLVITIVTCSRQQKKKRTEPEPRVDLPMVPTTQLHKADRARQDYQIMLPAGTSPGPSPKPIPRPSPTVLGQDALLSVTKAQEGHRTADPGEGKPERSPVPKPRNRAPQALADTSAPGV
ncbi:hypothetical protein NHX12_002700 [Muraenolepis orangiensis]|uniref:Ig-like domain-containing protein n=1 Tax=Muraenolepis orangiensis TaxID=630683 RepID=A0A9Q0IGM2_9TELE|nr:hypothetical protein NHX12_002700 [Muraenolepis orangiensis]